MLGRTDPSMAPFLRGLHLDLSCIATFSWRLHADVLGAASRGTINAHASILPRHRGPNPYLWTYHSDDREAGVTIHECDEGLDTGPLLRQARWPLPRGYSVRSLHGDIATSIAGLLVEVHDALSRGERIASTPQDGSLATRAPRVSRDTPMVDYAWPAERVWHFLAGMVGKFREPLSCDGVPALYERVAGFEVVDAAAAAGTLEAVPGGWRLWCRDGFVRLERGT
jgi:methionyl-tRNA formyltransferase